MMYCKHILCLQVYLHLLRLYLSTPEHSPAVSFAEESERNALETNLSAAFRLLAEQANRIDTVEVKQHSSALHTGLTSQTLSSLSSTNFVATQVLKQNFMTAFKIFSGHQVLF